MDNLKRKYTHSDDTDSSDKVFGLTAQQAVADLYAHEGYEIHWNSEDHIRKTGCQINIDGREIAIIARNVRDSHNTFLQGITVSKDLYFSNGGRKPAALFENKASIVCFALRCPHTKSASVVRCSYPLLKVKILSRWDKCEKLKPTEGGYAYNHPSKAAIETNTYRYKYPFRNKKDCKRGLIPLYLSDLLSIAIDVKSIVI